MSSKKHIANKTKPTKKASMSQVKNPKAAPPLTIKAEDDVGKGRFANMAQVSSAHESFILDFAFIQNKAGWLLSRIILSPSHAKRFHRILGQTIAKYENRYGEIEPDLTLQ